MSPILAIIGPSGSGKSSLVRELHRRELVDVPDDQPVDRLADAAVGGVEERDDPEAAAGETVVAGQRVPEVADADQADRAPLVQPEDVLDLVDQQGHVVAHSAGAV